MSEPLGPVFVSLLGRSTNGDVGGPVRRFMTVPQAPPPTKSFQHTAQSNRPRD